MINYFIFNKHSSRECDVYISGTGTYGAPERDREVFSIPGRNGDLFIDNGRYESVIMPYSCFILKNFDRNYRKLKDILLSVNSYAVLEDTYHPDEYRMAVYRKGLDDIDLSHNNTAGKFTIEFLCKPERYLKYADRWEEINGAKYNPTSYESKPLIEVTGNGSFYVNGQKVTVEGNTGLIYLDSDIQDAYSIENGVIISKNSCVSGDFPILSPGKNTFENEGITRLRMKGRYFAL